MGGLLCGEGRGGELYEEDWGVYEGCYEDVRFIFPWLAVCADADCCFLPSSLPGPTTQAASASSRPTSSSRTSSSSNLGENSSTSDPANGSVGLPVSASSGSQDISRSAEDERQPQLDTSDVSALLEYRSAGSPEVDPQIIEALKSKDRLFVLKLGEQMEALIKERQ